MVQAKQLLRATFEDELHSLALREAEAGAVARTRLIHMCEQYEAMTGVHIPPAETSNIQFAYDRTDLRPALVGLIDGIDGHPIGFAAMLKYVSCMTVACICKGSVFMQLCISSREGFVRCTVCFKMRVPQFVVSICVHSYRILLPCCFCFV